MRYLKKTIMTTLALVAVVPPVFAATLDRDKPTNFVVWAFLTCCALIIVAQVLPMIRMVISSAEKTAENAHAKKQQKVHIKN